MKKANGLTLDLVAMSATITKDFAKRANDITSDEYKTLRQLREDGYSVEIKTVNVKTNKMTHKGMTIPWMRQYIENHENRDAYLKSFDNIVELNKELNGGKGAYYASVKKYFFSLFPELTAEAIRQEIEAEENTIRFLNELEAKAKVEKFNAIRTAAEPTDERDATENELPIAV